jgi:UDP-glucose 4-epimerase
MALNNAEGTARHRVLITGGAGFIGANLVAEFLAEGTRDIVVIDDGSTGFFENVPDHPCVRLIRASILDVDAVRSAVEGVDSIVHLAALPSVPRSINDPVSSHHVNVTGTVNILDAARHALVGQVVVASSSSVYGANPTLPKHESLATRPLSPYAASKLAAEAYTLAFGHSYDIRTLAFRFFNVFGPLQAAGHAYAAVIPQLIAAALAGEPLPIDGDGTQSRDFTSVRTVVRILREAVAGQVSCSDPINLAYGSRVPLNELIALLETILGRPLDRTYRPTRPGDVKHSQADGSALKALFPSVSPVAFTEALTETVNWFTSGQPRPAK